MTAPDAAIGSSFDDFLDAEGIRAEVVNRACQAVAEWIVSEAMRTWNEPLPQRGIPRS